MKEVTDDLQHNIPIQAVDLLLEVGSIERLVDMKEVDGSNVWKICQYLLRIVHFTYEPEERRKIFEVSGLCLFCLADRVPSVRSLQSVGRPHGMCDRHEQHTIHHRHVPLLTLPAHSLDITPATKTWPESSSPSCWHVSASPI